MDSTVFEEKDREKAATLIWKKYKAAEDLSDALGRYSKIEKYYNFFEGRQWAGAETGGESLPTENFITATCLHKVAAVCQNNVTMVFLPVNNSEESGGKLQKLCNNLNSLSKKFWEKNKMERKLWKLEKKACIAGSAYLRLYDEDLKTEMLNTTNVFFSDEQNPNIQEQEWIIIKSRETVSHVRQAAKEAGLSQEEIDKIASDDDTKKELGEDAKKEMEDNEKITTLLYMEKDKETGFIKFARSCEKVIYQPETVLSAGNKGLTKYPLVAFIWEDKEGSSRGMGGVERLIDNQMAVNKTLATRFVTSKINAYGKPVYNENIINPEDIDAVGVALKVKGNVQKIGDAFTYVQPCPTSPEAKNLTDEIRDVTRDLSGAGDAALGNVNPERASGQAILAATEQASIPLSDQKSAYKQALEDIGEIYKEMLLAYRSEDVLQNVGEYTPDMDISVRIDISAATLASRMAEDEILDGYMRDGLISFEERVACLSDLSVAPKGKLEEILKKRMAPADMEQEEASEEENNGGNEENIYEDIYREMQMQGGADENVSQLPGAFE